MSEIAIYQAPSGEVEVRLGKETVRLRLEQMAELFGRDRTVVGRHVRSYRVKSPEGVRFRQWATALLRVPSGASCRQFIEMTTRFVDVSRPAT